MFKQTSRDRLIYDRIWRAEGVGLPDETAIKMIDELAAHTGQAPARIADLGCGTGRHVVYAAQRGLQVTGIDHSETALEILRSATQDLDCDIVLGDAFGWLIQQPPSSMDGVICIDSIHHTSANPAAVEQTAARIAKRIRPGGLLLITLLCDIRYSTGEHPPGRLRVSLDAGTTLIDRALSAHTVLTEQHSAVRIPRTVSQDPITGELVEATYAAERLLRLYQMSRLRR